MSDPPTPTSPQSYADADIPPSASSSQNYLSPTSSATIQQSPASSPFDEPPLKKRAWQVQSYLGNPSKATRSLWRRIEASKETTSGVNASPSNINVQLPIGYPTGPPTDSEPESRLSSSSTENSDTGSSSEQSSDASHFGSESSDGFGHSDSDSGSFHLDSENTSGSDCESDNNDLNSEEHVKLYEGCDRTVDPRSKNPL